MSAKPQQRRWIEGDVALIGQTQESLPAPLVFLQRREVERRVGMSRTTIYQRIANKSFPAPVHDIDTATVWWLEHEIAAWQKARIDVRSVGRSVGTNEKPLKSG